MFILPAFHQSECCIIISISLPFAYKLGVEHSPSSRFMCQFARCISCSCCFIQQVFACERGWLIILIGVLRMRFLSRWNHRVHEVSSKGYTTTSVSLLSFTHHQASSSHPPLRDNFPESRDNHHHHHHATIIRVDSVNIYNVAKAVVNNKMHLTLTSTFSAKLLKEITNIPS